MKIEYKDADGRVLELEVSDEVGRFCIFSAGEEAKSDRRNSRPDRHTSLEAFTYEDQRFFASSSDPMREAVEDSEVERLLSCLDGRQRELVRKCVIEGWSYDQRAAVNASEWRIQAYGTHIEDQCFKGAGTGRNCELPPLY